MKRVCRWFIPVGGCCKMKSVALPWLKLGAKLFVACEILSKIDGQLLENELAYAGMPS